MATNIYIIWEQHLEEDGVTCKDIYKVTFDEDLAKSYCELQNKKQAETFGDSIYKLHYFYAKAEVTETLNFDY